MSNKGRRLWNEICNKIARPGDPVLAPRERKSREEIIVGIVTTECGVTSNLEADDFASDLILELWESKKFGDDFDAVREYVRDGIRKLIRHQTLSDRKFVRDDVVGPDGRRIPVERVIDRARHTKPMQELRVQALQALELTYALPKKQRDCLHILAGGGNPVDVANDMGIAPWDAIRLIREAREFINRVDPLDEAA